MRAFTANNLLIFFLAAVSFSAHAQLQTGGAAQTDDLIEKARQESSSPIAPLESRSSGKAATAKTKMDLPVSETQSSSLMLKLSESYQTPKIRDFDWQLGLSFESFELRGLAPTAATLGYNVDMSNAGAIPFLILRFGFLQTVASRLRVGLRGFAGYGSHHYNIETPTGASLPPQINVTTYGGDLAARWLFTDRFFAELNYEQGIFSMNQSSTAAESANWSENTHTNSENLGIGWSFKSDWDLSAGYLQRQIPGSQLNLASANWFTAVGVRW